jgi:Ca2+-binding EF-hand superfamily protein
MLDETITQQESNTIFHMLDRDKTKKVDKQEFEKFFSVDPALTQLSSKVEKMKWAIQIFHEINTNMQARG